MTPSTRRHALLVLSMLLAAAPFVAGLIRAAAARHDLRLLWVAVASFLGAMAVRAMDRVLQPASRPIVWSLATFVVAALLAASTAWLLGARAEPAVWAVSIVVALFLAGSHALDSLARAAVVPASGEGGPPR